MGNNQKEEKQGHLFNLSRVVELDWKYLLIMLIIGGILLSSGFLAGNLWRISLYHSRVEQIEDINACYP